MIRNLKILAIMVLIFLTGEFGHGARAASSSQGQGFNFYAAAGPNFVFPTSLRVGWDRWEFGLLTRDFVGLNKNFSVSGSSIYSGFGIGINSDHYTKSLGFQAAIGFHYEMFWHIGLRGEMLANANLNGSTMCHGLLGVSYGF